MSACQKLESLTLACCCCLQDRTPIVKVADFGLAKRRQQTYVTGEGGSLTSKCSARWLNHHTLPSMHKCHLPVHWPIMLQGNCHTCYV